MAIYGYARVSSADQDTSIQQAALKAAGCSVIRTEKMSGASRDGRSELQNILDFLHPGDVLAVSKLDRLGRSTRDVLNIVHEIDRKGASLRVLEPAINTDGPLGRMVITTLAMVAEMELGFIRDRQQAGIERAKAEGKYTGGKMRLDHDGIRRARAEGKSVTAIAREFGCSRETVYAVCRS